MRWVITPTDAPSAYGNWLRSCSPRPTAYGNGNYVDVQVGTLLLARTLIERLMPWAKGTAQAHRPSVEKLTLLVW